MEWYRPSATCSYVQLRDAIRKREGFVTDTSFEGQPRSVVHILAALAEDRPVVLLLGQDAYTTGNYPDPVLIATLQRLGRSNESKKGWNAVLGANALGEPDMEWITERFNRFVQPEGFQEIWDIPWSAVFTTTIDPRLTKRFSTRGRQPEAVLAKDHFSRVPRSRSRPPIHFLFGRSDETIPETRVPRSRMELKQRTSIHANEMLNRIAETVTPLGVLVVAGYDPDRDWLALDTLLAPLSLSANCPIVWFGARTGLDSDFLEYLTEQGVMVPDDRSLVSVVAELLAAGDLGSHGTATPDEPGVISIGDGKYLDVSPSLKLRVEASAAIVDDTWTSLTSPSVEHCLDDFTRFHGDFGGQRNLVEGVGRGFSIQRRFETKLADQVEIALKSDRNRVVILHGQSGTGKTVAMAKLAWNLRKLPQLPVVFANDRVPQATDLADFCSEAERAGAAATVILCDANQSTARYAELANGLRSRGRRIVVVGTSYRIDSPAGRNSPGTVEAPAEVSTEELRDLVELVRTHANLDVSKEAACHGNNVLALLYRLLSASRGRIVSGINTEARAVEEVFRRRARTAPRPSRPANQLAEALMAAGFGTADTPLFGPDVEDVLFGTDAAGRMIDYVMVAGRLNCPLPVNLLLRVLRARDRSFGIEQISYLFEELDLFRWRFADDEGTQLLVAPRLQLEAELICRRRLADVGRELDCIVELIESVRPRGVDKDDELAFLLDLLQKLDRDGPRRDVYSGGYLRIGEALTTLRVQFQVQDASLMLQESAFRRAYLRVLDAPGRSEDQTRETRDRILNQAREAVEAALQGAADGRLRAGRRVRENLQVERASIYGFLAVGRARASDLPSEVWSDYLAARTAVSRAVAVADSYFPFDVGLWTPVDILDACGAGLPLAVRAEMYADIQAVLDQVDPERLPPAQYERYQRRRQKVARALGDDAMSEDAYAKLEVANPPVAYFLRTRTDYEDILGPLTVEEESRQAQDTVRARALEGAAFLEARMSAIGADVRCLHLLLQLQWLGSTGYRLLRGERRPLPHNRLHLGRLLQTVTTLNAAAGEGVRFVYRYLEATLAWATLDVDRAYDTWRTLARETEGEDASRVFRRLYMADDQGKPLMCEGRVLRQRSVGHWQLKVEGIPGSVDLLDWDFKGEELRPGRQISNFAIAFNYLGPIADPASRFGDRL
jgi:hypothetical protein